MMKLVLVFIIFLCVVKLDADDLSKTEKYPTPQRQKKKKEEPVHLSVKKVSVIGAGISGLAAARRVTSDRSNFSVNVFEARRTRYGGRVWTDKLMNIKAKGIDVDLGASNLNVISKNNPLLQLADDFELKTASVEGIQFFIPWERKVYSGDEINDITKDAGQILRDALNKAKKRKTDISVREAVDEILHGIKVNSPGSHFIRCLPSYIIKDYSTHNYRADLLDVGYEKMLLDGMGELIDRLVSGSSEEPPLHLQLNKPVRQIKVDHDREKVLIRFTDGTQVTSDIVVIAVPASVISAKDIMFEPDLPQDYRLAVEEIGIATSNKVILEFEQIFWPANIGVFLRAVQEDEERGVMQSWINIHKVIGEPVLATFIKGNAAENFETWTDEEVKEKALSVLTVMFGVEAVAKGGQIKRLQRSQWLSEEYSKGAHAYSKVGSSHGLWDQMSEPLCPYIYFVGEYTSSDDPGTLHGAYNSGIRAGDQILSGYCHNKMKEEEQRREEEARRKAEKDNNEAVVNKSNDEKDEL